MNLPFRQQTLQGVEGDQPQYRQHLRLVSLQLPQRRYQKPQLCRVPAADHQARGRCLLGFLHPHLGQPGELQDLSGILRKKIALLGQPHTLAGTLKELYPQFVLQGCNLMADGGLRNPQMLRRPGKIQEISYLHKAFQLGRIHNSLL